MEYQPTPEDNRAGKLYKKDKPLPPSSSSFELKVHPVVIDRKHVISVATRFYNQVKLDYYLLLAKIEFDRIPGE